MKGKRGQVQIDVPRDHNSEVEPQLVKKGQTRFDGLDESIISLYARGMTQRELQGYLEEIYGVEIWPSLISTITDAVLDEVRAWQARPLDAVRFLERGERETVINKILGHSKLRMPTKYLHSSPESRRRAVESLSGFCQERGQKVAVFKQN